MKKSISCLLACLLFFSSLAGLSSAASSPSATIDVDYNVTSFTKSTAGWETTSLQHESDFAVESYVELKPGAVMWQGVLISDQEDSPQIGDTVHASVTFRTHSNITNTNNVLIRVVANNEQLIEISSLDGVIAGEKTTLDASIKNNDGIIPDGSDKLWIELHNDTDGTLEIESIRLWGSRDNMMSADYAIPNANFLADFQNNWEYGGEIRVEQALSLASGVAAWRDLTIAADQEAPHKEDIVQAKVSLFIPSSVTSNDHVYLRLNDGNHTLVDVNNITDLPRDQWITVSGQIISNGATISHQSSQLWVTIYNDANQTIRMKDLSITAVRSATSIYDLNGDDLVNEDDLAYLQAQVDSGQYSAMLDFDKDGELTEKDVIFYRKYALHDKKLLYLNLDHFLFMNEEVEIDGTPMLITHLYSEPIDRNNLTLGYKWVGDPQEGFAAVDDVSRSVTAFAEHYRLYQDKTSYEHIKLGLRFLMWMQYEDGDYDNFVVRDSDGTIHKKDSYSSSKSFTWWAVRAYEAMAEAYSILQPEDSELKAELEEHLALNLKRLHELTTAKYGQMFTIDDQQYASWMLGGDAWLTATAINSLYRHYQVADEATKTEIEQTVTMLGEALAFTQNGSFEQFPYGGYMYIYEGLTKKINWSEWGSIAIRGMAYAGKITGNEEWINGAAYAADSFLSDLIISGRAETISPNKKPYPLINYGTASHVDNLLALYEVTQNDKYAKLAGLVGSWWTGNNIVNTPMFNQEKGFAYDGMTADEVNINVGGESLAEAIRALARLMSIPNASDYLYAKTIEQFGTQLIEIEQLFKDAADEDKLMSLPYGKLNSGQEALVRQGAQSGTNEALIYNDAHHIITTTELYPNWFGKQAIFVEADGYNNMRLFNEGELWSTIPIGEDQDQFQPGDYVKLDFTARVEFDTELIAEVFAVNGNNERTLIANAENMNFHARTWYSGVNSVKTTPLAPIPDDAVELLIMFKVTSTKTPVYEGFAMLAETKIYTMGVTEVRYGNTELSGSSYVELSPSSTRTFEINIPKDATYNVMLSYIASPQSEINISVDQQRLDTIALTASVNKQVIVKNIGKLNLTEGTHQLTFSNHSTHTSALIDAITFYPVHSYISYKLASGENFSVLRDAATGQLTWSKETPVIKPIPTPSPSSTPKNDQANTSNPFGEDYWIVQEQQLHTSDGRLGLSIPAGKSKLVFSQQLLQKINKSIQLLWDDITIELDQQQIADYAKLIDPTTQIVLSKDSNVWNGLSINGHIATTITSAITIQAAIMNNEGKVKPLSQLRATLYFDLNTTGKHLGLYVIQNGVLYFYGAGAADQSSGVWSATIHGSGQYVVLSYEKNFKDISTQHWAYQSIAELSSLHIVKGQTDQTFGVKKSVTEAELVTMLVRMNNLNKRIEPQRMNSLPWYDPYVASASEYDLIKLDSFQPNQVMTRQAVVAWVDQFLDQYIVADNNAAYLSTSILDYVDSKSIAPNDQKAWQRVIRLGIIRGDSHNQLKPNDYISREEIAVVLHRLLNLGK